MFLSSEASIATSRRCFTDDLLAIIKIMAEIQKKCIITFTEQVMRTTCKNPEMDGGIYIQSCVFPLFSNPNDDDSTAREIKVKSIFDDYRIQSSVENMISVLISTEALLEILKPMYDKGKVVVELD